MKIKQLLATLILSLICLLMLLPIMALGGNLAEVRAASLAFNSAPNSCLTPDTSCHLPAAAIGATQIGTTPELTLTKTASHLFPEAGQNLVYTITVTNNGPITATGGVISDALPSEFNPDFSAFSIIPSGAGDLARDNNDLPTLVSNLTVPPGQVVTVIMPGQLRGIGTVTPTGLIITNTATVTSVEVVTPVSSIITMTVINHELELAKTVSNPNPHPGEVVTFTIIITNLRRGTSGVTIRDNLPPQLTFKGPVRVTLPSGSTTTGTPPPQLYVHNSSLAQGARLVVTFPVTVNTGLPVGTVITNIAEATSNDITVPVTTSATLVTLPPPPPNLSLSKNVSDLTPRPGQRITYTIVVSNSGLGPATGSRLSDTLPDEVTFAGPITLNPAGAGVIASPPTLVDSLRITAGTRITVTVPVTVNSGLTTGTLVINTATITSSEVATPATDSVAFTPDLPVLTLNKAVDDPNPEIGQRITYTITVDNSGPTAATGASISDALPNGVIFAGPITLEPTGAGITGIPPTLASGLTITAGTRITVTVPVTVETTGLAIGDNVINTAVVTSAELATSQSGATAFTIAPPVLAMAKLITPAVAAAPGQTMTYTIIVTNNGLGLAQGWTVQDNLDPDLTPAGPVILDPPGAGTPGDAMPILASNLTITAGTQVTISFPVMVNPFVAPIPKTIINTATMNSSQAITPLTASASLLVTSANLQFTKGVSNLKPRPGEVVTYTLTIRNIGQVINHNLILSDTLPLSFTLAGPITFESEPPGLSFLFTPGNQGTLPHLARIIDIFPNEVFRVIYPVEVGADVPQGTPHTNNALLATTEIPTPLNGSVTLVTAITSMTLTKEINDSLPLAGQALTYTLRLTNTGDITLNNLTVTDTLPTSLTLAGPITLDPPGAGTPGGLPDVATIPVLASGDSLTITLPVSLDPNIAQGTIITNTAAATSNELPDPIPASAPLTVATPGLTLTKAVDNSLPLAGREITYTLRLTNTGDVALTNLTISDTLPAGITFVGPVSFNPAGAGTAGIPPLIATVPTLAPNDSLTVILPVRVSSTLTGGTIITNTAAVTSSEIVIPAINSALLTVATPGLTLTKTVDNPLPLAGGQVTYTLRLTNTGNATFTNLAISDTMPAEITFLGSVSFDPPGAGTAGTPPLIAIIPTLAPSESLTLTFPVGVNSSVANGTRITNTAVVTSSEIITSAINSVALTVATPRLVLTKRVNKPNPTVGEIITYTITVTNIGNIETTDMVILDTLPPELTLTGPVIFDPPGAGTSGLLPRLAEIPNLAPGSSLTITFQAVVSPGATIGTVLINTASITSTEISTPTIDAVAVTVVPSPVPILVLSKGVSNATPQPGATVTYTLSITNIGQANATGMRISDTLPAGLTFVGPISLNPPGAGTPGNGGSLPTLASNVTLNAGQRLTLTFPVLVNTNLASGALITNRASVTSTQVATPSTGQVTLRVTSSTTPAAGPIFFPLILKTLPAFPDLVGSFRLTPNQTNFAAGAPVAITVVVTNVGATVADSFWVDFYINPSVTPGVNLPWNQACSLSPCYGIAWFVPPGLDPGESVTLTSTPGSYSADHTIWPGSFASGTNELYLYVDSWNPTVPTGGILESNENNNLFKGPGLTVTGLTTSSAGLPDPAQLPPRPAP